MHVMVKMCMRWRYEVVVMCTSVVMVVYVVVSEFSGDVAG